LGPGRAEGREPSTATIFRSDTTTTAACVRPTAVTAGAAAATGAAVAATATCAPLPRSLEGSRSQVSLGPPNVRMIVAFMSTGLDPSFACQGLLFLGIRRCSLPAGCHAYRGSGSHRHTPAGNVAGDPSTATMDAPSSSTAMPAGGSSPHQHTSAGNVTGDLPTATIAPSVSVPSPPPSAAAEGVPAASAPTVQDDAGAEVVPSGPQDSPVTVEATPSGSQVPARVPEVAALPTAVADPTTAIPSDAPPVVGVGARPALSPSQLRRVRRLFLGVHSGLVSSLDRR
jgi:hypothetical protein